MPKWKLRKPKPRHQPRLKRKRVVDTRPATRAQVFYLQKLAVLGFATEGQWARFAGRAAGAVHHARRRLEVKRLICVARGYADELFPGTQSPRVPVMLHALTEAGRRLAEASTALGPISAPIVRRWVAGSRVARHVDRNIALTEALIAVDRCARPWRLVSVLRDDSSLAGATGTACTAIGPVRPPLVLRLADTEDQSTLTVLVEVEGRDFTHAQRAAVEARFEQYAEILRAPPEGMGRVALLYVKRFGGRGGDPQIVMKARDLLACCAVVQARDLHRIDSFSIFGCTLCSGKSSSRAPMETE